MVNKLGFAVQLCTLRWQGYFLGDTRGLPAPVLETIAPQLGLLPMSIDDLPQNEKTRWEHLECVRQHLRFQQCDDFQRQRLLKHYVPVNLLAADYSQVLQGRGVTLYAHTADNCLRLHQQPIPCRLREAAFVLDGPVEHDTELDPRTCYTDTHGYTEVVMATAALLGFELPPRIRDIHDQTLYKLDYSQHYPHLDPILTGAIKAYRITPAWDEVVRLVASMSARVVSPSLVLLPLDSYARQNRIHQALAEIGRVHNKTVHILRTLDDQEYRRRMGRELNKGEASHELSRFLCFGKEGALREREFGDQLHTFSCLSVLHNAVVAWNMVHIEPVVEQLRAEGQRCDDELLSLTTPLLRRHLNPFGPYYFDLVRMRQDFSSQAG